MRATIKPALVAFICFWLLSSISAAPPEPDRSDPVAIDSADHLSISEVDDSAGSDFPSDPMFNEIILTPEGVIAIGTDGLEWYYDFEVDAFVEGLGSGTQKPTSGWRTSNEMDVMDRCTEQRWIGTLEKTVLIGYDEFVEGDIIAYGRVTIRGWVKGSVKSIRGRVLITESGHVDGSVEATSVVKKPGGTVLGEIIESESPLELEDFTPAFSGDGLVVVIVFTVLLMFFCFLLVELMPRQIGRMQECIGKRRIKTSLLGFLFLLLLPIVIALAAVTIIGLVVVPFIPFIYLGAFILGEVIFGNAIGRITAIRLLGGEKGMLFQSVLGVFLHMSLWILVAVLLGQQGDVAEGFGVFFLVVAIMITAFPILSGLGAAILTRFGFRDYKGLRDRRHSDGETPAPAPPPIRPVSHVHPPDPSQPPEATDQSDRTDESK
ncbi:MAG: polymer-forming cytoskeletal protein [candidate division Zixibacteria bacterium]|nr:polymer-forming cytoskeletal protein [candidate division Zixibacteria bacterium]